MKVSISEFPHQPGTLGCCRECEVAESGVRDCSPNPMNCVDFQIANHAFIESKRKEADTSHPKATTHFDYRSPKREEDDA